MGVLQCLSVVALRQLVGGACNAVGMSGAGDDVVKFLTNHFTNHSQKLTNALQSANDRAWEAFEIALAGDSLWQRCTVAAEDKAFAEQVRAFLNDSPLRKVKAEDRPVLDKALQELRSARKRGALAGGALAPAQLAKEAGAFARFSDPQKLLDAERTLLKQVAGNLGETCPNLNRVILAKVNPPLLAVAVRYYFRREIETDRELFQGLAFVKLEALPESQDKGFAALTEALSRHGDRVERTLAELSQVVIAIDERTKTIESTTKSTHDLVQGLDARITNLVEQLQLQNREVRARDSMSIRNDAERQLVKQLVAEYRSLPEERRRQLPGLLSNLGKLELAAGDFGEAQKKFQTVADMQSDPKAQAEAHFNAYQAALQRAAWAEALASFRQAIALDAARFTPFPEEYEPTRILGAAASAWRFSVITAS
jgi:hypothetical protein